MVISLVKRSFTPEEGAETFSHVLVVDTCKLPVLPFLEPETLSLLFALNEGAFVDVAIGPLVGASAKGRAVAVLANI
jgi:hypothetical protein